MCLRSAGCANKSSETVTDNSYLWTGWFLRLWTTDRRDIDVIAILMTESHFRSPAFRTFEFVCYSLLRYMWSSRAGRISLGVGQVQARFWPERPTLASISSPELAYDLIRASLLLRPETSLRAKVAIHVGEVRGYYMKVAERFRDQATRMANKASLLTPDPPPVTAAMTDTNSTPCSILALGQA